MVGAAGTGSRPQSQEVIVPAAAPITWADLSGQKYGAADLAKAKATVFLFSSTQCPIANRYTPRLIEVAKAYAPKGVAFFLVNSNSADSAATVKKWASAAKITFPVVKDSGTALADRLGAHITPEAAVVDASGEIRYIGRIDDSADPGKVTRKDLHETLDAVLSGQPLKVTRTRAFGCAIFRDTPEVTVGTTPSAKVTYARDIAPLLQQNCVTCHREGDVAPFALENYAQAKQWAPLIKDYTARRIMPPWKAVPGHGDFHDARHLTDDQIKAIAQWADTGAPQGDPKDLPAAPKLHAPGDWPLGKPDLVLQPVRAYHLEADGKDVYRNFTLPADFEKDRFVSAFDFQPGNRTVVHHMIAYIDETGASALAQDNKEAEPGWSVAGGGSGIKDDDWGDGWAPGMTPRRLEPGVAVKIAKGAKLVLQVHYHKSGKPEVDHSKVALYWAAEPIQRVLHTAPLGNPFFRLKPNVARQEVKASMLVPFDAVVRQVLPHMHMLGTEMKVTAMLPDGTEKSLIWIKNWDFNWQMAYRYKEPVKLPKGTRISLVAYYDNTTANPYQPNNPPREVTFGEQTTDEMCFAFIGFTRDTLPTAPVAPAAPAATR